MAKAEYRSAVRSRKLILSALVDLLQEKPLEKITVTDVVNRAQINRGTFYAHYADIPDVVDRLLQQTLFSIREALTQQPGSLGEAVHALMTQIRKILEEDLFFSQKVMNSSAASLMQERLVQIVVEYLLQNRDAFYSGDPKQYELWIRFGAGGLSNLFRDWFEGKLPYTLEELTRIGEELLCRIIQEGT